LTLAVRGNSISGGVVRRQRVPVFSDASIGVERKSMGHTVAERWWKNVVFVYLAWRLWKSVVTLAVRGNSISGGVVRRQRVPVF
jgi:hypothetical protein